jgi:hypothetical protein
MVCWDTKGLSVSCCSLLPNLAATQIRSCCTCTRPGGKGTWTDLGANNPCRQRKRAGRGWATRQTFNVAGSIGRIAQAQVADEFAANLMPLVQAIQNAGAATLSEIARALNARRPARGSEWHRSHLLEI